MSTCSYYTITVLPWTVTKLLSIRLDTGCNGEVGSCFLGFGKASKHKFLKEVGNLLYFFGILKMKYVVDNKPQHQCSGEYSNFAQWLKIDENNVLC